MEIEEKDLKNFVFEEFFITLSHIYQLYCIHVVFIALVRNISYKSNSRPSEHCHLDIELMGIWFF